MTRRYLLVDDNREFVENMAEILTDEGAEVTMALDASEALDALAHGSFDVMLTDMKMPGLSGADLLRHVRQRDPGLPVVLASAYTRNEQLAEVLRLGLLASVVKTTSTARLLELLLRARRDAVVLAVCEDDARVETAREALADIGVTVRNVKQPEDLQIPPVPLAAIIQNFDDPLVHALRARFPNTPLVKCADSLSLTTRLDPKRAP